VRSLLLTGVLAVVQGLARPADSAVLQRVALPAAAGVGSAAAVTLSSTAGQPVAGSAEAPGARHWIGFWLPETSGQPPSVPDSLALAKLLPDGARVTFEGLVATTGLLRPGGFLYVSRPDRASGIRVLPLSDASAIVPGTVVSVTGTLDTTPDGERQIASALLLMQGSREPLEPLGISGRHLGGAPFGGPPWFQPGPAGAAGPNNVGLLVRIWGTVAGREGAVLMLRDPSGADVGVLLTQAPADPAPGSFIEVRGPLSLFSGSSGLRALVIPRWPADVRPLD